MAGQGRGWHGDSQGHARAGQLGGKVSGGNFARDRKKASSAGKSSSGNFAYDREKARRAGQTSRRRAAAAKAEPSFAPISE